MYHCSTFRYYSASCLPIAFAAHWRTRPYRILFLMSEWIGTQRRKGRNNNPTRPDGARGMVGFWVRYMGCYRQHSNNPRDPIESLVMTYADYHRSVLFVTGKFWTWIFFRPRTIRTRAMVMWWPADKGLDLNGPREEIGPMHTKGRKASARTILRVVKPVERFMCKLMLHTIFIITSIVKIFI